MDETDREARRLARKRERQMRRRDEIADAAEVLIAEHGPRGFTTIQLAEVLGVSHGSLFYYFDGGRDELLAMVAVRQFRDDAADIAAAVRRAPTGAQALVTLVRERVDRYLADPERVGFQLEAMSRGPLPDWLLERLYPAINGVFDAAEERLVEDREAGRLASEVTDVRRWTMTVHHMVSGLLQGDRLRRKLGGSSRHELRDMADDLCALVRRGTSAAP